MPDSWPSHALRVLACGSDMLDPPDNDTPAPRMLKLFINCLALLGRLTVAMRGRIFPQPAQACVAHGLVNIRDAIWIASAPQPVNQPY